MNQFDTSRTIRLQQKAAVLLEQLVAERERLETALSDDGRFDQFKVVTGSSSLDRAIATTRRIISDLEFANGTTALERDRSRRPVSPVVRTGPIPAVIGAR